MRDELAARQPIAPRLRFPLDAEQVRTFSVKAAIKYGMEDTNYGRRLKGVVDTLTREMRNQYGVTANNTAVKDTAPVRDYFTERTAPDQKTRFQGVDLIIASKQTGGSIDALADNLYQR